MIIFNRIVGCLTTLALSMSSLPIHAVEAASDAPIVSIRKQHNHSHSTKKNRGYDYIVVGLGTAGAVLARKLSDPSGSKGRYKNNVLVLEAGFNMDADANVLNPDSGNNSVNQTYLDLPPFSFLIPALINGAPSSATAQAGIGWGGTSIHNFMIAVRGTPTVYNNWAALSGDSRWGYDNLLPTIRAVETYTPDGTVANYEQRGDAGLSKIMQLIPQIIDPIILNIANVGTTAVGITLDYNDPTEGTVGYSAAQRFNTTFPRRRSFSAMDWIQPVVTNNGIGLDGRKLTITSGAAISRVLFSGNKAIGVEYYFKDKPATLFQAYGKKIILSAGTLHTAGILERSGIGDPAILKPLGIPVLVNSPNVGNNLQVHYGATVKMTGTLLIAPPSLSAPSAFVTGFTDLRGMGYPADGIRRYNTFVQNTTLTSPPIGPGLNFGGFMANPQSRGYVHITSTDPTIQPKVNFAAYADGPYTTHGTDASIIVA